MADRAPPPRGAERAAPHDRVAWSVVAALVLATVLVRVPLVRLPLSSDEAGFLVVGGQWGPGRSLYGDYWVDRPPGLIALTHLAQAAGGGVGLRLMGAVAAAVAVVAAALVGRRLAPRQRWAGPACAGLVAALVSNPLLSVSEVNGEILALPLLLLGTWMLFSWLWSGGAAWAAGAGAMAAGAVSIKQNLVDVVVLAVLLGLALLLTGRGRWRRVLRGALWFTAGAGVVVAAVLVLARSRGTDLAGLWDAVVVFRVGRGPGHRHRGLTRHRGAGGTAGRRLRRHAVHPWCCCCSPGCRGACVVRTTATRSRSPGWSALLLVWEGCAVALGGSYWFHYLVGTVPGLLLLLALVLRAGVGRHTPRAALVAVALVAVTTSTLVGQAAYAVRPPQRGVDEQAVVDYVRSHHDRPATGVVAFGSVDILRAAGLSSPYQYLWSLPVRVRDPDLSQLESVLRGADRPSWIVRQGASLASWGIDAAIADRILHRYYEVVFTSGDWQVLQLRSAPSDGHPASGQRRAARG